LKINKTIICLIFLNICLSSFNCSVDTRQIPPPREIKSYGLTLLKKPIYLGKFEVFTSDRVLYVKAWQFTFKSILINNRIFSDVREFEKEEKPEDGAYVIDIEVTPEYKEDYNYWLTWPAIYPMPAYWPLQVRTGNYSVNISYNIYQNNNIIIQSSIVEEDSYKINLYGFFRTQDFEKMIETTNLKALDKCSKDILKNLM